MREPLVNLVVTGDDAALLAKVRSSYSAGVRRCWVTTAPHAHPASTLAVTLTIDADGIVTAAEIAATGEAPLETCVGGLTRRWRFAAGAAHDATLSLQFAPP
jgi:hypothetical protein